MHNINKIILTELTKQTGEKPVKSPTNYIMGVVHDTFDENGKGKMGFSTKKKQESEYSVKDQKQRQKQRADGIQPEQKFIWDKSNTRGLKNYLNVNTEELVKLFKEELPEIQVPGHGVYKFEGLTAQQGKNLRIIFKSPSEQVLIKLANPFKFQTIDGQTYATPQNAADYQLGLCVVYNMSMQKRRTIEQALELAAAQPSRARTFNVLMPYFEKRFQKWWLRHPQVTTAEYLRMSKTNSSPIKPWVGGNNIPKTDITDGSGSPQHRYSVKMLDSGGAQLASGGRQQSLSILRAAIMYANKHEKTKEDDVINALITKIDKGFTQAPVHIAKSLSDHKKDIAKQYMLYRRGEDGQYIKHNSLDYLPAIDSSAIQSEFERFISRKPKPKSAKTPKTVQDFFTGYLTYEVGVLLNPVFGDIGTSQRQYDFVELPKQMQVDPTAASKFVLTYLSQLSAQGESLEQLFKISKIQSEITKELTEYLTNNATIKQYCVYEAASGAAKFSGQYITTPEKLTSQAIASYILQITSGKVQIQYIPQWAKKHSGAVTVNASFKTTTAKDFSVFSALRFLSTSKLSQSIRQQDYSDSTYYLYQRTNQLTKKYKTQIENTLAESEKKITNIQTQARLLTEAEEFAKLKKLITKGFDIVKATWQGVIKSIKQYYTKLVGEIMYVLKTSVNKGIMAFSSLVGVQLDESRTDVIFNI